MRERAADAQGAGEAAAGEGMRLPRPMMHELAADLGLTFAELRRLALGCGLQIGSGSRRVSVVEERRLRGLAAARDGSTG